MVPLKKLECKPYSQLNKPREIDLVRDRPESAVLESRVRVCKLRRIEGIQRFGAKLGFEALRDSEILEYRAIPVFHTGAPIGNSSR